MTHWKPIAAVILVTALLVVLYLAREPASRQLIALIEGVESMGALAPVAYIGLYTVAILVLLPAAPFLLAAGALFGLTLGTAYGFVANTVGGAVAFACSRRLARSPIERRLGRVDQIEALDRALSSGGLRTVFLIRLSPVLPASLINYGLGLTSVRFSHYFAASLATIPFVFLYVYYGKALGELTLIGTGQGPERGAAYYGALLGGVLATLLVTVLLTRRARRILEREQND